MFCRKTKTNITESSSSNSSESEEGAEMEEEEDREDCGCGVVVNQEDPNDVEEEEHDDSETERRRFLNNPLGLDPDDQEFLSRLSDTNNQPEVDTDDSNLTIQATGDTIRVDTNKQNGTRGRRRGKGLSTQSKNSTNQSLNKQKNAVDLQKENHKSTLRSRKRKRSNSVVNEERAFLKSATEAAELIAESAGRKRPDQEESNDNKLTRAFCDTLYYYLIQLPTQKRLKLQVKLFEETSSTVIRELGD